MTRENNNKLTKKFEEIYEHDFDEISFYKDMDYKNKFDIEKLMAKRKKHKPYRHLKIASVIIAFFLCSSCLSILIANGSVEAGKDKILDFIFSINDEGHKVSDKNVSLEVLDLEDLNINKARDLIPNLIVEKEILSGYKFDQLLVEKIDKDDISAFSQYFKGEELITINQSIISNDHKVTVDSYDKVLDINGGYLYTFININDEKGLNSIYFVKKTETIEITGRIETELLIRFIEKQTS